MNKNEKKNNQKIVRNVAILIFITQEKQQLRIFHICSLMINLTKLNVGRYFIADAVSNLKKEKQIKIVQKLKTNLIPTYLLVKDTTIGPHSCGPMFKIVVESPAFAEKTKLQQHKMVMDVISEDMAGIHAVNLKTRTPTELNVMNLGLGIMPEHDAQKQDL